jgi:hypothetical protein
MHWALAVAYLDVVLTTPRRDRAWVWRSAKRDVFDLAEFDLDMREIEDCVICGRKLVADRVHVDTCSDRCFRRLLRRQRAELSL